MSCYISSNDNRYYAALEQQFGDVAAVTAENRIPAVKLAIRHNVEAAVRRDKTGTRTFSGVTSSQRKRVDFDLVTYMTSWAEGEDEPCYSPLIQGALGGVGVTFNGGDVVNATDGLRITLATPHNLAINQAIRHAGELRFVSTIVDDLTFIVNAPFSSGPGTGDVLGKAITYMPANSLPSLTLFDFWQPAEAVQRLIAGAAINTMQIGVNADFHQFRFTGEAADLVGSSAFIQGSAGMEEYPPEPLAGERTFPLVPGSMGQAWFGAIAEQFHTVVDASIRIDNNIDLRRREFGMTKPACIVAGQREVSLDMTVVSNTRQETIALYEAAAQRSPIQAMLQLGAQQGQLCGVYLPVVVPEIPEYLDDEVRLQWKFRNCRAQGTVNDEVVIAFA